MRIGYFPKRRHADVKKLENPYLVYAVLKSKKRFEALRAFTLESGQQEIERQNQRRKNNSSSSDSGVLSPTLPPSRDESRGSAAGRRPLGHVPEDGAFAIGGDDSDEEDEPQNTPSQSSPSVEPSRTPSVSSLADDNVPSQLRGMSEKARGKLPASQPTFSRQNSTTSLSSYAAVLPASSNGFIATPSWVCHPFLAYHLSTMDKLTQVID